MRSPRRRLRSSREVLTAGFAAVRTEHQLPVEFSPEVLAEAERAADGSGGALTPGAVAAGRRDMRDVPFVTLDPVGSTDLDQAMHLARAGTGYRVTYAIADTAAFVAPGGPLDTATRERATTVYCPDTRVPLHPVALSEAAASLLPGQERPAVVWSFGLEEDGAVRDVHVERALVRSTAQLDYPTTQRRLDAGAGPDDVVTLLAEIGTRRAALERARGGVSLARPEQEVVDAPDGGWSLAFRASLPVEDHNAQVSLLTGMAAAELMVGAGVGILRTMPAASPDAVATLRRQARALDVPWPADQGYGDMLAGLDRGRPGAAAFLAAATGLFRGAAWTAFEGAPPADHVHGAIAAPYAHVTAPLRRLVDRFGLEICLAAQAGRPVPDWVRSALPTLGSRMAAGAARAASVDRACTDLVEAAVLAPRVGQVFDGVALDERTVQLHEPAVIARLEEKGLPEGEPVRVRLLSADVAKRSVQFRVEH
ncbi:RNB domain-containing ribonuclease [Actinotalea subterranea]|uniref:RNB domain-containing ribonuclease n=1 Tax=Actinotalea subterranea TaxID=2607497 RepID=UPI0011EF6857|nr:RNB domain-containing ribonuclease [Actinotalea subterranea]